MFQGFRTNYHFTGSTFQAKVQCGNAWPVKASKVYFELWAAHIEAFNAGFIEAEDEVLDLYDFLEKKGVRIPKPEIINLDLFNTPPRSSTDEPEYRYLHKIEKTVKPRIPLQLWGRRKEIEPAPQRRRPNRLDEPLNFFASVQGSVPSRNRSRRQTQWREDDDGNIIID